MVTILQRECDLEVKNLLLEFNKNRQIQYRIKQVNEAAQRQSGAGNANSIQSLGHYRKPSGGSIDKLNPKDIDSIIAEITVMHSRIELFFRFMRRRLQVSKLHFHIMLKFYIVVFDFYYRQMLKRVCKIRRHKNLFLMITNEL